MTSLFNGQTARRLETRRKLLDAATVLFADRGLGDVTTTAIARQAGVATGTFYLHFDDKHELFEVLVQEALDEIRAQFHPDHLAPRGGARRSEIESMVEVVERRRDLIRAVFEHGENSRLAERIHDRVASRLEPAYRNLFRDRQIGLHPAAAAQARAAVVIRIVAWWAEDPSRATRDEVIDILMETDPRQLGREAPSPSPTNTHPHDATTD
ncbi:MAG: TetR/AcrR family transcriptional regulator [Acidimicrobiia bacterium]|nr:TetR/AcrR family transcriptional regulator [Acidimicrobiia bacterium]